MALDEGMKKFTLAQRTQVKAHAKELIEEEEKKKQSLQASVFYDLPSTFLESVLG